MHDNKVQDGLSAAGFCLYQVDMDISRAYKTNPSLILGDHCELPLASIAWFILVQRLKLLIHLLLHNNAIIC